ncbi:MAG: Zn-dependent protease-like protein [Frankiales bacterium]|nr:Zn-dependent protease-like protein [Frankiales bacterium]
MLGVPLLVQPSWLVFAALLVVSYGDLLGDRGSNGYVAATAFALLLLLSVVLHEVGHCVAARLLDLPVRSISVSFLAGLTEITAAPQTPARAYAVSAAGPMVSVLLTGTATAATVLAPDGSTAELLLGLVAVANAIITVFNLLPGLPLDGGRILHAVIWRLTGDEHGATVASAQAGRVVGLVVIPVAVLVGIPLAGGTLTGVAAVLAALIGGFVYLGATASLRGAQLARRLPGLSVARFVRPALPVPPDLPLSEAVRRAHERSLHAIVVVDDQGRARGLVSEAKVLATAEQQRPWVAVSQLARTVERELVLDRALAGADLLAAMAQMPATEYLVTDPAGGPPGVLVASDVQAALAQP